ncbi:hypothetical protein [Clostridium saccharoperbutylacetonicum]|uniref:hypothetical protein n=1 Tax=Clostridium saccharoperbutylacetonicum TaxID=36745 RepID=UPI0039E87217
MKKKLISKLLVLSILCTSIPAIANNSVIANAATTKTTSVEQSVDKDEKEIIGTLDTYLNAFKTFNTDSIIKVSKDVRCKSKSDYISQLNEFKTNPNYQLTSFEIGNNITKIDEKNVSANVKVTFKNGYSYDQVFKLSLVDGKWMVVLGEEMNVEDFNKTVVKEGKTIKAAKGNTTGKIKLASDQLASWSDTLDSQNPYTQSEKFDSSGEEVTLNYRQYFAGGAKNVKVKYAITVGVFNSVKASRTVTGSNPDEGEEITLSVGSGQTVQGGKITVTNMGLPNTVVGVFGEAYDE